MRLQRPEHKPSAQLKCASLELATWEQALAYERSDVRINCEPHARESTRTALQIGIRSVIDIDIHTR